MILKKIMVILLIMTFHLYSMDKQDLEGKLTCTCLQLIIAKQQEPRDNKKIECLTDEINGYVASLIAQNQYTQEWKCNIARIMS